MRQQAVGARRGGGSYREHIPALLRTRVPRVLYSWLVYCGKEANLSLLPRKSRSQGINNEGEQHLKKKIYGVKYFFKSLANSLKIS